MRVPLPPNEEERLAVLASFEVLDTSRESAFDDLVDLAAAICETPISAVTLIDRDRVWCKALRGMESVEVPRELAFCSHAILTPERPMVVEDARLDSRFSEHPAVKKEPGIRFYASSTIVSSEGYPVGTLCVAGFEVRGVTDRQLEALMALGRQVAAQLELRRTLASLKRQAEALARARDEAEAASRAKGAFLANLGHEIRTPMNGIIGLAEVLAGTQLTSRQRQYVETIAQSGKSLMGVLAGVLEYAEMETGLTEVRPEPTMVAEIVKEVAAMVLPAASSKEIWLKVDVDETLNDPILVDPMRIRQLLTSLVGAGVRATNRGTVELRARRERRFLILEVEHPGSDGVPEPVLVPLRTILAAMEGELRQAAGEGVCCVSLQVPVAPSAQEPLVLVAEDNEVNSLVLSAMLEDYGCRVTCVENGIAAVEALEKEQFDLVFMDIQMPEMDGVQATRVVRGMETHRRTPIVAVTASAIGGDHAHYREAGIDDMIEKPISERTIVDALRRWLPQGR